MIVMRYAVVLLVFVSACGSFELGHVPPGSATTSASVVTTASSDNAPPWTGPAIRKLGRQPAASVNTPMTLIWPADALEISFIGPDVSVEMASQSPNQPSRLGFYLDDNLVETLKVPDVEVQYTVAAATPGRHRLTVVKLTEAGIGEVVVRGVQGQLTAGPGPRAHFIEFVGDSISAGYGDEANTADCPAAPAGLPAAPDFENAMKAFGPQCAQALGADWSVIAWSGKGIEVNRDGTSKNTMAQLFDRVDPTDPNNPNSPSNHETFTRQPDLVVIDLGTNDFWALSAGDTQAIGDAAQQTFVTSYVNFINHVLAVYPAAQVIVAIGPLLSSYVPKAQNQVALAEDLQARILAATASSRVFAIEFRSDPSQFGCDDHPNALYQQLMATQLADFITQQLQWRSP